MPDAPHVVNSGSAARRAAQQLPTGKEAPGSKAHLVRYDGDVLSVGNDRFSINALRHKLGNDICLTVALSRKANPLAVCDCYTVSQDMESSDRVRTRSIPLSAKAVADAARLRSNKRIKPQHADAERTANWATSFGRSWSPSTSKARILRAEACPGHPCPTHRSSQPLPPTCCPPTRRHSRPCSNQLAKAEAGVGREGVGAGVILRASLFSSYG
eukprot:6195962-Pleurochrysis_carterae.AAC.1